MTERQFKKITKWQSETFGEATALSEVAHLKEELNELEKELVFWNENERQMECPESSAVNKENELADCFILLFGAVAADGMKYADVVRCIDEKMQVNYQRKWGEPEEDGVVHHIQEQ